MTILELHNVLGKAIEAIMDDSLNGVKRERAIENAEYLAKVSKQMINGADIVLRADKLAGTKRVDSLIGNADGK